MERKKQLFENIVRLRRAGRALPGSRDIAAVRASLEDELGATVSRRLAASLLGVSHTALTRWVQAGDLPVLYTVQGRKEIPVAALLDLFDAVGREREAGQRSRHLLEPAIVAGRNRAERIRAHRLVADHATLDGHRGAELRSLAYHRVIAGRLRRPMVDEARHVLWKWRGQGQISGRYAEQWEAVLRLPVREICRVLRADTPAACDMRQNSPFAGMLSEPERRRIIQALR